VEVEDGVAEGGEEWDDGDAEEEGEGEEESEAGSAAPSVNGMMDEMVLG
jgi:hypothetical protein